VLPGAGSLRELWRPVLEPALRELDELVVDLRSGTYANLARLPGAVTVRVVTGSGATVSHFNKAYKGKLARALAVAQREPATVAAVLRVVRAAGLAVEQTGDLTLELLGE
jgi:cytoplasmic iron level regulating protein YaaA (DUF328/UPF0246 family)